MMLQQPATIAIAQLVGEVWIQLIPARSIDSDWHAFADHQFDCGLIGDLIGERVERQLLFKRQKLPCRDNRNAVLSS